MAINTRKGDVAPMNWQENDERYENERILRAKCFTRTKLRRFVNDDETVYRAKHSGKRSHRQKTIKDDFWPARDY
jgi:hypothetical protein